MMHSGTKESGGKRDSDRYRDGPGFRLPESWAESWADCILNEEDIQFPPGDAILYMKFILTLNESPERLGAEVNVESCRIRLRF